MKTIIAIEIEINKAYVADEDKVRIQTLSDSI